MNGFRPVDVEGDRYLSQECIKSMIEISLGPKAQRPICDLQLATNHGVGSSIASFVASAMVANISFLEDQVNVCCGELLIEEDFTVETLMLHLDILMSLNSVEYFVTADRVERSPKSHNILTKAFAKMPSENVLNYNTQIIDIRQILREDILGRMGKLVYRTWTEQQDWTDDIYQLLRTEIEPKLVELIARLQLIREMINSMIERIVEDWERDVDQVQKCPISA